MVEKRKNNIKPASQETGTGFIKVASWFRLIIRFFPFGEPDPMAPFGRGILPLRLVVFVTRLAVVLMIILVGLRGLKNVKSFKGIASHVTPVTSQEMTKPVQWLRVGSSVQAAAWS